MGNGDQRKRFRAILEIAIVSIAIPQLWRNEYDAGAKYAAGDTGTGANVTEFGGHGIAWPRFVDPIDAHPSAAKWTCDTFESKFSYIDSGQYTTLSTGTGTNSGARYTRHQSTIHGRTTHSIVSTDHNISTAKCCHRAQE